MSKALLVIDMQQDICYDDKRKDKVFAALPQINNAINEFLVNGYKVIYTCFSLPFNDEQFIRFGDKYCVEGTKGAEIITELLPLKGEVIVKKKHSAFFETELDEILKKNKIEELYLAGLQTQICIMTTAADASFRGYRPIVIKECVISTRDKRKTEALNWVKKYVGEVYSLSEVIKKLKNESI
ncbi:MAG: isochorismatase family cysteine hydrolase [Chlorobium sp.]